MQEILSDTTKFKKVSNQDIYDISRRIENRVRNYLRNQLHKPDLITDEHYKRLYPNGSHIGIMYGLRKIHKRNNPMRPICSAIGTSTYELGKFVANIIKPASFNKLNTDLDNTFNFVNEIKDINLNGKNNSSELGKILQHKINVGRIRDSNYDTRYPTLITFVRNICEHFPEHMKTFEGDGDILEVLGGSKTNFIKYVLSKYPHLIADIFDSFRKALPSRECLNDDYDIYFENLCNSVCRPDDSIIGDVESLDGEIQKLGLNNSQSWRDLAKKDTIAKDDILNLDCRDLRPYIVVELVLKFVSQTDTTSADIDDLSKKYLVQNIALMNADYYHCVNHETKNLQTLGVEKKLNLWL